MLDGEQPSYLIWLAENTDIDLSFDILEDAEGDPRDGDNYQDLFAHGSIEWRPEFDKD